MNQPTHMLPERGDTLLEFPCDFPLKIMGKNVPEFASTITELVCVHAPEFDPATVEMRPSSSGNYMGLTCTIVAISQVQLDGLYLALTGHPLVKVVL